MHKVLYDLDLTRFEDLFLFSEKTVFLSQGIILNACKCTGCFYRYAQSFSKYNHIMRYEISF